MWCDVMWCDVMWCDMMLCDMMWYDLICCDVIWYEMMLHLSAEPQATFCWSGDQEHLSRSFSAPCFPPTKLLSNREAPPALKGFTSHWCKHESILIHTKQYKVGAWRLFKIRREQRWGEEIRGEDKIRERRKEKRWEKRRREKIVEVSRWSNRHSIDKKWD